MSGRDRFAGQTAIVTGGARGIGQGIARRLAAEGAKVVAWDIDPGLARDDSGGTHAIDIKPVDVADPDAVAAAMQAFLLQYGQIDIFVNNAGITGPVTPVEDYALDDWQRVIALDLTAVFFCCRACIPPMRRRGYGRIVNVASIAGKEPVPGIAAYGAAKAGVIGFTKSMARELAGSGVLANCVAPAMVQTDLLTQMTPEFVEESRRKIPLGRFLSVEELSEIVAFAASPQCSFTTGFTFDATGGRADY